jgi:two-component system, OmpR family, phosphate regulon sensor histidine kinase PhoR
MFLILYFLAALLLLLIGFLVKGWFGASWVLFAASFGFAWWQSQQKERLQEWLRQPNQALPDLSGETYEIADRTQHLLRQKDIALIDSQASLGAFLNALQASPDGVIILNYFNSIQWCNHMAEAHFGLVATRDQDQIINNLIRDPVFSAYLAGNDFSREIVITGHNHQIERPVKIAIHIYPYANDAKLVLSRDITAIEQADAMRRDFVANVSHEIRTPLTVLSGFIEAFQTAKMSSKDSQHYLSLMAQQSSRMQDLTQDLLTLSKLEGSPPPNKDAIFDLNILINTCKQDGINLLKTLKLKSTFNIELNDNFSHAQIMGVLPELQSALSNLIGNAIRYTPNGGLITLTCTQHEHQFEIAVSDTGAGIEPQHLARLTERFYRVDTSRSRESGGTGLGLAIVKHVMLRHNGELRIESIVGKGSKFALLLPNSRIKTLSQIN